MHNIIIMIRDLASPIVLRSFLCPACVLHELWRLGLKDYLWPCKSIFHLLLDIHYFYLWYILFSIQLQIVVENTYTHKHTHARNNIRHINGNNGYLKWCLQNILTREVTRQHTWPNGNICVIDLEPYNVIICGKNTHTPSRFADTKAYPQVKNDRGRWKMHKTRVYAN